MIQNKQAAAASSSSPSNNPDELSGALSNEIVIEDIVYRLVEINLQGEQWGLEFWLRTQNGTILFLSIAYK